VRAHRVDPAGVLGRSSLGDCFDFMLNTELVFDGVGGRIAEAAEEELEGRAVLSEVEETHVRVLAEVHC